MIPRNAVLVGLALVLLVGSSALSSRTRGSTLPAATFAATSPAATAAEVHFAHVRAEYIDLDGNHNHTDTTLTLINKSLSKSLYLGDISALGPDGLAEVLAVHTGLNGVGIPPLGSIDLRVDSARFPGLQPKVASDSRGVETVLVSFSGSKEMFRLSAAIHLHHPDNDQNQMINRFEGHFVVK